MTITTSDTTTLLGQRVGNLLAAVGLSEDEFDMTDAINYAVRELGYTVTSQTAVSDSDLSSVADSEISEFLDVAELRQLETLLNELVVKVTVAVGPRREQLSDIRIGMRLIVEDKRRSLNKKYGTNAATFEAGTIGLRFAEVND